MKKIKRALISVYHKDGLLEIVNELVAHNVEIVSTGGTASFLADNGVQVVKVEDITSYPSILGDRVKTLHPKIFGAILGRCDNPSDNQEFEKYDIKPIDLVIVDLYPFEEYVARNASQQDIIEKIDIGGISLIRAAAKNYEDVMIVASKNEYKPLLQIIKSQNCETDLSQREYFAAMAFGISSNYDSAIFSYFNKKLNLHTFSKIVNNSIPLRYGENPHQKGRYFGTKESLPKQLHGKEISYNNLLDIEASLELIADFSEPTVAIVKHNNACGIASREDIFSAWQKALECDPISAFGGVIVANREIDKECAEDIDKIFFEIIMAPSYSDEALKILKTKKNRIILLSNGIVPPKSKFRSLLNGILVQERDTYTDTDIEELTCTTRLSPKDEQVEDLIFANKVVKHSKSNAIVIAKDRQLLASGIGQTSRVDALKQAIQKAKSFNFDLSDAVMASDAFFPFRDCVDIAATENITAIIQPGGSIRDQESIDACDEHNIAMVTTGIRHFKH